MALLNSSFYDTQTIIHLADRTFTAGLARPVRCTIALEHGAIDSGAGSTIVTWRR